MRFTGPVELLVISTSVYLTGEIPVIFFIFLSFIYLYFSRDGLFFIIRYIATLILYVNDQ